MQFFRFFKKPILVLALLLMVLPSSVVFSAGGNFQPENTFVDQLYNTNDEVLTPYDMVMDTANHRLFVSDNAQHRVLVFNLDTNNELIDRIADNVLGQPDFDETGSSITNRTFSSPTHLALDQTGLRLFVSDTGNNRVMVFDISTVTNYEIASNVLGQPDFITATSGGNSASMNAPYQLSFDDTNDRLFVADSGNHRISVFDVSTITDGELYVNHLGNPGTSGTSSTTLKFPRGVYFENKESRLFVADTKNHRILSYDLTILTDGEASTNVLCQADANSALTATTQSGCNQPNSVWGDGSAGAYLFTTDTSNNRVLKFDVIAITDGESAVSVIGQPDFVTSSATTTQSGLSTPRGLFVYNDSTLYVADAGNNRDMIFDVTLVSNGENAIDGLGHLDDFGEMDFLLNSASTFYIYTFDEAHDIAVDTVNHRLFVADPQHNRVLVFDLNSSNELVDEIPDYVLGQANFLNTASATTQSGLSSPHSVAFDSTTNRLFVTDTSNSRVVVYDVETVTTGENAIHVLGAPDFVTAGFGPGQDALTSPELGLAIDEDTQLLYVADTGDHRIMVFDVASIVDGEPAVYELGQTDFNSADQEVDQSSLISPTGIALDLSGNRLFVTDNDSRVMVFDISTIVSGENAINVLGATDFTTTLNSISQNDFNVSRGLAYDQNSDSLFVTDEIADRVMVFDVAEITNGEDAIGVLGQTTYVDGSDTTEDDGFHQPEGIFFESSTRKLYVADASNSRVSVYEMPSLTTSSIDSAHTVGDSYSQSFTVSNSQGNVSLELVSGTLPTGLSFSGTDLEGTPTIAGTYTFEMRAVDAVSPGEFYSDTKSFSIVISHGSSGGGSGSTPYQCADNVDNDGDGFIDYPSDPGCLSYGDNNESNGQNNSPFQCNDAGDNDGDGLVDMSDPGCQTPFDNDEYNVFSVSPACSDGIDNDGDEDIDFAPGSGGDSGCISPFDQSELNALTPVLSDDDIQTEDIILDPNDGGQINDDPSNLEIPEIIEEPVFPVGEDPSIGLNVLGEVDRCDVDLPANATIFQVIQNEVINTFCIVQEITIDTYNQIDLILNAQNLNFLAQIIAVVGLVMGAIFNVTPVLFLNPFSFTEVVFIPYRIWTLILNAFGMKKRNRPWGTVYDSVTKQPLDPVIVALYDVQGKEVATSITDMDGRYGFLVPPGSYRMVAKKTHYQFPSIKLAGKTRDELYLDLYYGTEIEVKSQGDVLIQNIPMDPIGFDWNEFAKRDQKLMKFFSKKDLVIARISDAFFGLGFFFSVIALLTGPTFYNIFIFATYLFFIVVRETGVSRKAFGSVKSLDGAPVAFAIVRIFTSGSDTEVAHKVTNELGKYFCLIQNGNYYMTIEKKNTDETYTKVLTTRAVEVKNGLIREKVVLP